MITNCSDHPFTDETILDIATMAYSDMLQDTDRNVKFEEGIKRAVMKVHKEGRKAVVLDVGTGSGILSMMAVHAGADIVYACESYVPICEIAAQVFQANGLSEKVKLIRKHSSEIKIGEDMEMRANILVSEIFDTELIGEGVLKTFNYCISNLLQEDYVIIPDHAVVYATIVSSEFFKSWNFFKSFYVDNQRIDVPFQLKTPCKFLLHDLQLSRFGDKARLISPKLSVFRFQWSNGVISSYNETSKYKVICTSNDVEANAIFVWWDLFMDADDPSLKITCEPSWYSSSSDKYHWRDHWMQTVYYPSRPLKLKKNETFFLIASHDEYSFSFDLTKDSDAQINEFILRVCPRSYLASVNSKFRREEMISSLKSVVVFNSNHTIVDYLNELIKANGFEKIIKIVPRECIPETNCDDFDIVVSEPWYENCFHSLDNLFAFRRDFAFFSKSCQAFQRRAIVKGIGLELRDLWKNRSPSLEAYNNYDLKPFAKFLNTIITEDEVRIGVYRLSEYESFALTSPFTLCSMDISNFLTLNETTLKAPILRNGKLSCVAIWVDYELAQRNTRKSNVNGSKNKNFSYKNSAQNILRNGIIYSDHQTGYIEWVPYQSQQIYFCSSPLPVSQNDVLNVQFSIDEKGFSIQFNVITNQEF